MTELSFATDHHGDRTVLAVGGEIDLQTAPVLRAQVDDLDVAHGVLVLDLSGVTFLDSSGLGALLGIKKQQDRAGGRLLLARVPDSVGRIIAITKMDQVFERADD